MYSSARSAAARSPGSLERGGVGHRARRPGPPCRGSCPTSPAARARRTSTTTCVSNSASGVGRERAPVIDGRAPTRRRSARTRGPRGRRTSSRPARSCPARAPHSIDMLQTVIRCSIESARIASPAYSTTWPTPPSTPIWPIAPRIRSFAVTPGGSAPIELEQHRLRPALRERLRREDVLDLGRADPERERAEGAVRRRVAVAADDRLARLRQPELRADHVDDALVARARPVERGRRTPRSSPAAHRAAPSPSGR